MDYMLQLRDKNVLKCSLMCNIKNILSSEPVMVTYTFNLIIQDAETRGFL